LFLPFPAPRLPIAPSIVQFEEIKMKNPTDRHFTPGLTMDAPGALYGTTSNGGAGCTGSDGCGIVFKIAP